MDREMISSQQLGWLMLTILIATPILFIPAMIVTQAHQDGLISMVGAYLFCASISWAVISVGLRFPDQTIFHYISDILGPWLGKAASLLLFMFFAGTGVVVTREFGDFLVTSFLPETPLSVFIASIIAISAYAVSQGLEVIARANEALLPWLILAIGAILVLSIPDIQLARLTPLFQASAMQVIKGGLPAAALFGETVAVLGVLVPQVSDKARLKRSVMAGITAATLLMLATLVAVLGVFGPYETARFFCPAFGLAKYVSVPNTLERIESLIVIVWIGGAFIKISLFYLCSVYAAAQICGLSTKILIPALGALFIITPMVLFRDSLHLCKFLQEQLSFTLIPLELTILILVLVAFLKRRRDRAHQCPQGRPQKISGR